MIVDTAALPVNHEITGDVIIIGAGPAGIALALSLANSNKSIVIIESGGTRRGVETDQLNQGESIAPQIHAPPSLYRTRVLGGASAIWGGRCVPLDAIDFEQREWVPHSGWPIRMNDVSGWLIEAAKFLEIGAATFDERALRRHTDFIEGFRDDEVLITLERFSPPTHVGRRYRRDLENASGISVITHATCLELNATPDNRHIRYLHCCGRDGRSLNVRGYFFVIAAGGLENARLLLASISHDRRGIGNEHDLVGRFYMCHIEGTLGELALRPAERKVQWGFERTADGVYSRRKLQLAPDVQRRERLLNGIVRLHHPSASNPAHGVGILSLMYLVKRFLIPEYRRKIAMIDLAEISKTNAVFGHYVAHFRNLIIDAPGLCLFTINWVVQRHLKYRRVPYVVLPSQNGCYPLDFNGEQMPNPDSRVYLAEERDRYGIPKLIVDWKITDNDVTSIVRTFQLWKRALELADVGTIKFDTEAFPDLVRASVPVGGHHIGTTRMSTDPLQGVVDENCKVHSMDNLFIAGSSVFPTSGQANPTLTVVALAMRLGAHLRSRPVAQGISA